MTMLDPKILRPKVGIGVLVLREGRALLGKRKGSHGAGTYALPGGHMEFGESFEDTVRKEVREETSLEVANIRVVSITNNILYGKHYINIDFVCEAKPGDVVLGEPEKCEGWEWYGLDSLPENIFPTSRKIIEHYQSDEIFDPIDKLEKFE